jgi:predicted nucleic acid-binding protein
VTIYFCDSSALIKRYVVETGSAWVELITAPNSADKIFAAQITRTEVVSGIARLNREGKLSASSTTNARLSIDYHMTLEYSVVELSEPVLLLAEDLLLAHPLRAYDAVQLASALDLRARLVVAGQAAPVFVSADRRLLAAAEAEGLLTDDPNRYS